MASALTIDISATRAITATGRLVAGEAASVGIVGATPKKLYLINAARDVIAYCDTFDGGNGTINLATEQIAAIIQDVPAGRAVSVACLIEDANDVIGCGFVPLISAPMPEQLEPINIDPYLRESQVGAGLAIVDGKLVCTVNPSTYLSKAEAAQTYATQTALAGKQNTITDLAAIRAGAAKGATAYQVPPDGIPAADMKADVVASLMKADTALQSAPVQSVNSQTGAVVLTASDVGAAPAAAVHYAIDAARTVSGQLADRACNRVVALADNVADIVLTFPDVPQEGGVFLLAARDFLVLVTNTTGNTGNITFSPPSGAVVYGDGFTNSPASGETWLYSVTEVATNTFWVKSVKMEVAQ